MIEAIDGIVSIEPFVVRRRIGFSDCDPAGVMFAGNYYVHALWAWQLYAERRLGGDSEGASIAIKAASFVHHAPVRAKDVLDLRIAPARAGRTSFTVSVQGRSGDRPIFDAELTFVCKPVDVWQACPVPKSLRHALCRDGAE